MFCKSYKQKCVGISLCSFIRRRLVINVNKTDLENLTSDLLIVFVHKSLLISYLFFPYFLQNTF